MTQKSSWLNNNGAISQEAALRNAPNVPAQKDGIKTIKENYNGNVSTEESLRAWQSTLDSACKTPDVQSKVGVTKERIIPISSDRDQPPTQGKKEVMQYN